MNRKSVYLLGVAVGAMAISGTGRASDTTSYSYDPLGRLVAVATTGGPNNGVAVSTSYDRAGNRSAYNVAGSVGSPPPPPPPPPPGNQAPVAVADSGSMSRCGVGYFNVLANDHDPDGNTPLRLVSASGGARFGEASVVNGQVEFVGAGTQATATVSYVVSDSLGATATGQLTINLTFSGC
ncbi:Ig-like domain-containing protein [Sphingosinicella terrae]|uniref:Ig-like domain-containing protein n=1 Tax=Sphingosinicella terrae TaxID=2172047 RepID=UPI0013B386B3|nr:Ig-like domain-containing protein [Sphingosinicella terrae]